MIPENASRGSLFGANMSGPWGFETVVDNREKIALQDACKALKDIELLMRERGEILGADRAAELRKAAEILPVRVMDKTKEAR